MRIATRLTASIALAGLGVFGAYGLVLVRVERADLRRGVEREMAFLGQSLRVGVENAIRDRQVADVQESALRVEGVDTEVDVYVYDGLGGPVSTTDDSAEPAVADAVGRLAARAVQDRATHIEYVPPEDPAHLLLATPLLGDNGDLLGVLAVSRPLTDVNEDLLQTSGGIAATVGVFVLAASALGLLLGAAYAGRPLARMSRAMGQVREGDLESGLPESGADEIVGLAREFNRMVTELRDARRRLRQEEDARRELMRTLQAADRLVTIGQLSAAVAHEIGSPLQVLHGRARALLQAADDPERTRKHAEVLVRESERITRIVEQLLALTRRRPARREPVELLAAAKEVVTLLELEARRRRIAVLVDGHPTTLVADSDQMRQVVLNLVANAIAACAEGGHVDVRVSQEPDRCARLVVRDDGEGIPADLQAHVFDPLFTTRADRGGAGLGLAVVRGIVTEHGGRVWCVSEVGSGSTFTVEIPEAA